MKERIEEMVNDDPDAKELYGNLMRLKTHVMLTEESLRLAFEPS